MNAASTQNSRGRSACRHGSRSTANRSARVGDRPSRAQAIARVKARCPHRYPGRIRTAVGAMGPTSCSHGGTSGARSGPDASRTNVNTATAPATLAKRSRRRTPRRTRSAVAWREERPASPGRRISRSGVRPGRPRPPGRRSTAPGRPGSAPRACRGRRRPPGPARPAWPRPSTVTSTSRARAMPASVSVMRGNGLVPLGSAFMATRRPGSASSAGEPGKSEAVWPSGPRPRWTTSSRPSSPSRSW